MTTYLFPNLRSKKAFKEALAQGKKITAIHKTPFGDIAESSGKVAFSGPHYPEPHRFYGTAIIKDGKVIKIS